MQDKRLREIGRLIDEARKEAGITKQALGEACGYVGPNAFRNVIKWEQGQLAVPSCRVRRLSEAIHVPLDQLIP